MKEFTDPTIVERECPVCGKPHTVIVEKEDLARWRRGVMVQDAFPYLSPSNREVLMTGIDGECYDKLWREDDEPPVTPLPEIRDRLDEGG